MKPLFSVILPIFLAVAASGVQAQTSKSDKLALAIAGGDLKSVKQLIAVGVDVNAPLESMNNVHPVALAIVMKQPATARLLLQKGANPNVPLVPGDTSLTLLHYQVDKGETEMVKLLVDAGANLEVRDRYGSTPLNLAAKKGATDIAKILLEAGAIVDSRDDKKRTPLHWAAFQGQEETVALLISKGADVEALAGDGKTPMKAAKRKRQKGVIRLLRQAGATR